MGATATVATTATLAPRNPPTVARVASVAVATPTNGPRILATKADSSELARLLALILPGDDEGQREALPIACADPDAALKSFRALTAGLAPQMPDPLPQPSSSMSTCEACRNLTTLRDRDGFRRCSAALRRRNPVPDIGRRCEYFRPLPGDPDQRTGRERWPMLLKTGGG